jgi:hypothetical protein
MCYVGLPQALYYSEWCSRVTVFLIPFFIIKSLQLRQRQKFGLIGVFSLGIVTMAISFGRFMIYTVSNYDLGDTDGGI